MMPTAPTGRSGVVFRWWHGPLAVLAFVLAAAAAGVAATSGGPEPGPGRLLRVLAATAAADWLVVALVAILARQVHGSVRAGLALNFRFPRRVYRWVALAVPGLFLASLAYDLLLRALGLSFEQGVVRMVSQLRGAGPWTVTLILGALVIPAAEEAIFRGCLYPSLRERMRVAGAMAASALVFAAIHFEPGALPPLFLMGLVLAWFRERTGSLVPCILVHGLNNLIALVAVMVAGAG